MRVVKDAEERKNEILDAADVLFSQKGFDGTSISDIIERVGIARGTVYYHFKSKEDIMDVLIDRYNVKLLENARAVAPDKSIPVMQRLVQSIAAMNMDDGGGAEAIEHMHKPQNALMHQKIQGMLLREIPPILVDIVEDGIEEELFSTPYPYECVEMCIAYINTVFDEGVMTLKEEELKGKVTAFLFNLERIFGAKPGSFAEMAVLFRLEEEKEDA